MKITNRLNLPAALAAAVDQVFNKEYVPGAHHYVTQLTSPPRLVVLREKYADQLEIDVADAMHVIRGLAVAHVLEQAGKVLADETHLYEERFETTLTIDGEDVRVSCRLDAYEAGVLSDYKDTSVYAVMSGTKDEWKDQLNFEYVILRNNEVPVNKMQIVALLKDFRPSEAKRKPDMPQQPFHIVDFPVPLYEHAEAIMVERIRAIRKARAALEAGEELPRCTTEEMWADPEVWAVMKKGGARAVKRCSTELEATAIVAAQKKPDEYEVQHRPYTPKRCIGYCPVSKWCSQFAEYKAKHGTPEAADEEAA